jgi:PAS domain S-box-containing protein
VIGISRSCKEAKNFAGPRNRNQRQKRNTSVRAATDEIRHQAEIIARVPAPPNEVDCRTLERTVQAGVSVLDSDERYRRMVELSPDGIFITRESRIVFVNPAAVRIFGASSASEVLGRSPYDFFHIDQHLHLRDRVSRLLDGGTVPVAEERAIGLDGTVTDVEVACTLFEDSNGRAIQSVMRDITERKRTEAALRESEERLSLAFAGAQEGVWDWNLETGHVVYSTRWKRMLGYDDHEIEPHVSAWERLLHPDDHERARELHAAVARGERTYEAEFRLRHKAGHYVDVLSRGLPVRREPGGPVVRIVGTHFDLTERKRAEAALRESEERLTLAFEGAQEGVYDWDLETGAVVYSKHWKRMLGYEDHEIEPHVSAFERLVHPDDLARATRVNTGVAGGDKPYETEFRLRHKNGHYVHVLSRGYPVRRHAGGPVVRIVGTHFDLTERKQAEEARERERSERARTELLGRMVFAQEDERRRIAREMHDQFGEQLTALGLRIRMLKEAAAGREDLSAQIEALDQVAQRLDRDVDHLVWELRPTALDDLGLRAALANYVQDWSMRVSVSADLHAVGLTTDRLASEIETTLYRIAQEALNNIAKHARASHVDIILERRADQVSLIVEDDGIGFNPNRMDGDRRGFGLLGMRERAALVGATLQIESAAGEGTTIFVRMQTTPAATIPPSPPGVGPSTRSGPSRASSRDGVAGEHA